MTDSIGGRGLNSRAGRQIGTFITPPVAGFAYSPTRVVQGVTPVDFDGSQSTDPDGSITQFKWAFPSESATGQTATRYLNSVGEQAVSLTVTDDDGESTTFSSAVDVLSPIIEDWEDGLGAWSGDTGNVRISTTSPFEGAQCLELAGTSASFIHSNPGDGLGVYPEVGDTFQARFLLKPTGGAIGTVALGFGYQDADNHYLAYPTDNGGQLRLYRYHNGNQTLLTSSAFSAPTNEWLYLWVHWGDGEPIAVEVRRADGTQVSRCSKADGTFTSGGTRLFFGPGDGGAGDLRADLIEYVGDGVSITNIDSHTKTDGLQTVDVDGDGLEDLVVTTETAAYWYEQPADPTSTWPQNTVATGQTEIEGANAEDFDGDGTPEAVILDQGAGDVVVASADTDDPTGTWSSTIIDGNAPAVQSSTVVDVDGDGEPELVYVYEGIDGGQSGATAWLDYTGGDVLSASNWTKHIIDETMASWWIADGRHDISGDGTEDDVVVSARQNNTLSTTGELFYLSPPADPTSTWTKTVLHDGSTFAPVQTEVGEIFGNGHGRDVVAAARTTGDGIHAFDASNGYARTKIVSGGTYFNVQTADITPGDRDDLFVARDSAHAGFRVYEEETDSWTLRGAQHLGSNNKYNDRLGVLDVDNDGRNEAILVADDTGVLEWWDVNL